MKRYYYKGKEISEFKANLLCIGAGLGLLAAGAGCYLFMYLCLWVGVILEAH